LSMICSLLTQSLIPGVSFSRDPFPALSHCFHFHLWSKSPVTQLPGISWVPVTPSEL
jgi:hypothetical protein